MSRNFSQLKKNCNIAENPYMKKIFFALCLLVAISAEAQKLKVGINAGATFARYRGNYYMDDTNGSLNVMAGFTAEYPINELSSIVFGLNYTRKSVKSYEDVSGWDGDVLVIGGDPEFVKSSWIFQYVTLPVMAKIYLWGEKKLYANAGGYVAHLIDVTNYFGGEASDLDFNSAFGEIDAGLIGGIGYPIKLGKDKVEIELRDEFSLMDQGDKQAGVFSPTKSNTLCLLLIWYF